MRFWDRSSAMEREFERILAVSLDTARNPESVASILARYPEHAPRLEPLLRTTLAMRRGAEMPVREQQRLEARRQFQRAAAQRSSRTAPAYVAERKRAEPVPVALLRPLWSTFAPVAVTALLFLVALVPLLALTSSSSLPGDWNYGFKRSTERVRLALTLDPTARFNLQLALHERRLGEIEHLAAEGRLSDPSVLKSFSNETETLVQTVSANPSLGPSEALKVAQISGTQAQVLAGTVTPNTQPAVQTAVVALVDQSQQAQAQASQAAKVKEAATRPVPPDQGTGSGATGSATATATPSIHAAATAGTPRATASPSTTAGAMPSATATGTPSANVTPGVTASPLVPPRTALINPPPTPASIAATGRTPAVATPTPVPTPLLVPAQPTVVAQRVVAVLQPGQWTFVGEYVGPTLPVPEALASINGNYDAVYFTQPTSRGTFVYNWVPSQTGQPPILEYGSLLTIHTKPGVSATLTYTATPPPPPGPQTAP